MFFKISCCILIFFKKSFKKFFQKFFQSVKCVKIRFGITFESSTDRLYIAFKWIKEYKRIITLTSVNIPPYLLKDKRLLYPLLSQLCTIFIDQQDNPHGSR